MRRTRHAPIAAATWALLAAAFVAAPGCAQQTTPTSLRALERSGRVSFVCLAAPGTTPSPALPLSNCTSQRFEDPNDFAVKDGKTTQPHLYALVTQTTRGEVAVIDMSTQNDPVMDANPRVPGASFLPVGAQPSDIVSTPGGTATFVGVAEIGREGLFALPSVDVRTCVGCEPKTLSGWPACALPGAPGEMLIVADPEDDNGGVRATCDGAYEPVAEPEPDADGNYPIDLAQEGVGRQKIVVTIPDLGAIAVVDAQRLLDAEPGSFDACPIDRWVPLEVDLPASAPPPPPAGGPGCVAPAPADIGPVVGFSPRPAGIAHAADKLYVADLEAPVVHVLDMATPCEPAEREPLLPSSLLDPSRVVTTNQLTASPLLSKGLGRFLYVVDDRDGSLMVFDISEGSTSRRPITRPHPEWTPAQAPDRVEFGVPVQDLVMIERDVPQTNPATGVAAEGERCSPDPDLVVCEPDSMSCDSPTLYRTSSTFDRGAGPTRMRGAFAYVVLGTGQIALIDVDDYDALCRAPKSYTHLYGCPPIGFSSPFDGSEDEPLASTGEASCNVVVPHTPRSANYMKTSERTGQNEPGLPSFPLFFDQDGSLQSNLDPNGVVMRATLPVSSNPDEPFPASQFALAVGSNVLPVDPKTGLTTNAGEVEHTVAMNLEDPRAHSFGQNWSVSYEGALPGFTGKAGRLSLTGAARGLFDAASRFCDAGVLGQKAWEEMGESGAGGLADYVQIASDVPAEDDAYWTSADVGGQCTYQQCRIEFGTSEVPKPTRDIPIVEAYQDHLELGSASVDDALIECCFPTLVAFNVRAGNQWVVVGDGSGFLHHVIATPEESASSPEMVGACRNSCDPRLERRNGRVRRTPHETFVKDGDPRAFINPFFRFAINDALNEEPRRGMLFQFATQGSFKPLVVNLAASTTEIQPQAISFLPSTGELAITDGSLEGLIMLSAGSLNITRQYY
ncbi:hypothetical protein [Polyangium aurulentum]|uniref:hypothetical protein n=1 Tax=Polyangium aurulentum TaxID=2567896 RepID=UPI0010AEC97A|nr:hypothetical protein [Polyangium aurulentum]UQA56019.1 hypothetical protein E8A73_032480 [Polyangium aurulentum]